MLKSDVIVQTTSTPFLKRDKGSDAALSSNISNLLFTNLIENYEREKIKSVINIIYQPPRLWDLGIWRLSALSTFLVKQNYK